jgi:hypothetical protein
MNKASERERGERRGREREFWEEEPEPREERDAVVCVQQPAGVRACGESSSRCR